MKRKDRTLETCYVFTLSFSYYLQLFLFLFLITGTKKEDTLRYFLSKFPCVPSNQTFTDFNVPTALSCAIKCMSREGCTSFNFYTKPVESNCELSQVEIKESSSNTVDCSLFETSRLYQS